MSSSLQFSFGTPQTPKNAAMFGSYKDKSCSTAGKVVLVMVDDDEDDCLLVQEALKDACISCKFHCVPSGNDLLDYLLRQGRYNGPEMAPRPDLILLDLNMPGMSGRQVLKRVKADTRFRAIPVIILTTSRELEDIKVCYDMGANSYITKHSSFDGLLSSIRILMEYWTEVAVLPPKKSARNDPDEVESI